MPATDVLDALGLQDFQKRTVRHVFRRMSEGQQRFLVSDEVGLGKTKVAQGVVAMAVAERARANVLYLAPSGNIVGQNLGRLASGRLVAPSYASLGLLAEAVYGRDVQDCLIGLTPIKDLRNDHFGSVQERALLWLLLERRHSALMRDRKVIEFFRGRAGKSKFEAACTRAVPPALRTAFEMDVDTGIVARLGDPAQRARHKREIVGSLRATLATCVLRKLDPALVVVDEIQRFSDTLLTDAPTAQVEFLLGCPLLLLSATPYRAARVVDRKERDPHEGFIDLVRFLNHGKRGRLASVQSALASVHSLLVEPEIREETLRAQLDALGRVLRRFMVRTGRPFDAHVRRVPVSADVSATDLAALQQAMDLLKRSEPSAKDKRHRFPEFVELWKSTPHLISALGAGYAAGRDLDRSLKNRARLPTPSTLTLGQLRRDTPLTAIAHPRLRAMMDTMGGDARERRLWLPPTLPYVKTASAEGESAGGPPSKTLVFTSWAAAPAAIATALNLKVEARPSRAKDLELARTGRAGGTSTPVRSVYALAGPLWRFAKASDPAMAVLDAGRALGPEELVAAASRQLVSAGVVKISGRARRQDVVDLALGLNAKVSLPATHSSNAETYLRPAQTLMDEVESLDCATMSKTNATELAEMAIAAPGTCAYRALTRSIPELGVDAHKIALSGAAISIGHSITRLFQRPLAVSVVEGDSKGRKMPYWRKVLRFCLRHDLQSVLDEYVFLLVRDSAKVCPAELANGIAAHFSIALSTVGGLSVVRPKTGARRQGPAMFARALGEHDAAPADEPRKDIKKKLRPKGRQANPLLAAFNSPFPPFVLVTTSTGQEGLDMHRYCRRLIHWNLPSSPLALEQREGRVDRFLSLGVRTNIAKLRLPRTTAAEATTPVNPWDVLLEMARSTMAGHESILAPFWHFGSGQPIEAIALNVPFSREETAWDRLLEEASWYRLVLGQPDPAALLARLSNLSEGNREALSRMRLDLLPSP